MKEEDFQSRTSLQCKLKCQKQCEDHKFVIENTTNVELNCQVEFCPKYQKQKNRIQNIFPIFSNDKKFYTSSFILETDRKTLQDHQHIEYQEYQKQVNQFQNQIKIVFPKPSKSNTFCMICKDKYESYFQHITNQDHKKLLEDNQFTKQIEVLTQKFCNLHPQAPLDVSICKIHTQDAAKNNSKEIILQKENEKCSGSQSVDKQQSQDSKRNQDLFSQSNQDSQLQNQNNLKDMSPTQQTRQTHNPSQIPLTQNNVKEQNVDQEDSIEIVGVKPAKIPRNPKIKQENQLEGKQQKKQKGKKKQKKIEKKKKKEKKSKSKQKKKKKKSNKKKSKKKHKKQRKQEKKINKSNMKIQIDSPPITSPLIQNKMAFRVGLKAVHPPQQKPELVLIQKCQIQDAELDLANQKILENIVATISKGPPPQAPRQYRKAFSALDIRLKPTIRINQLSPPNEEQKIGNKQSLNSYQQNTNQVKRNLTTDKDTPYQQNVPELVIQSVKQLNTIPKSPILLNLQKNPEKPDWQKLKSQLISNQNQGQLHQNSKVSVISLDQDQQKQSENLTFVKTKANFSNPIFSPAEREKSNVNSQSVNYKQYQNTYTKSIFSFEKDISFNRKLKNLARPTSNFPIKNKANKINFIGNPLTFGVLTRESEKSIYPLNSLFPNQYKNLPSLNQGNQHLTKKYCDKNHQQKSIGGVIDLEIDQIQETQAVLHQRQEFSQKQPNLQKQRLSVMQNGQQGNNSWF